jgi:hypothetical protein
MNFDQNFCIRISRGFFVNLNSVEVDGCAIYCAYEPTGSAIVQDSTFPTCSVSRTSTSSYWGGACLFRYPAVVMHRCCGNNCDADAGKFCYFPQYLTDSTHRTDWSQVTQVLSGFPGRVSEIATDGGIYLANSINATFNHCNFSHNTRKRGSALFCQGLTGVFNASWLTVYNNTGNTGRETVRYATPRISYANFIENPITAGYAVISTNDYGMSLTQC